MPYLIFAIVQLFAINTLDLYSSGVTLQSLIPRLQPARSASPIDTVICGAIAAYAVFSTSFFSAAHRFLLFIILWLGALVRDLPGGQLAAARTATTTQALLERARRPVLPQRRHSTGQRMIAQVVGRGGGGPVAQCQQRGVLAATGPLSSRTDGSDLSVFVGLLAGGVVYYLLAGRQVRAEGVATRAAGSRSP